MRKQRDKELSVDTDVSGESDHWYAGAEVRIDNVNKANDSELRTIAVGGVAAGVITITAGLTASKVAGSYVHLLTRNIRVIGHTGSGRCFYGGSGSILGADIRPSATGSGITSSYGCTSPPSAAATTASSAPATPSPPSAAATAASITASAAPSPPSAAVPGIYYGYGNTVSTISGCDDGINGGYGNTQSPPSAAATTASSAAPERHRLHHQRLRLRHLSDSDNTVSTISGCTAASITAPATPSPPSAAATTASTAPVPSRRLWLLRQHRRYCHRCLRHG